MVNVISFFFVNRRKRILDTADSDGIFATHNSHSCFVFLISYGNNDA